MLLNLGGSGNFSFLADSVKTVEVSTIASIIVEGMVWAGIG